MAVDISKLTQKQLSDLISKAEDRKQEIAKDKLVKLRKKVNDLIQSEGYTLEDVLGTRRKATRRGGKVPPKYSNPANPAETWSGRGKRPRWFNAALKAGKKEADLLIK